MKKRRKITLIFVATIMLMMTGCGTDTTELENRLESIEEKLDTTKLQERLDSIESKVDAANQEEATQKKLDEANATIEELQKQIANNSSSTGYEKMKFWQDGKLYEVGSDKIKFYSDYELKNSIKFKNVISPVVDDTKMKNGGTIYSILTDKGIVYSAERPYLYEIS